MPYCLSCNYPLTGLPSNVCPECGRVFDPADPATMNTGRPVGPIARVFLSASGRFTLVVTVVALALLLYSTGMPRLPWRFTTAELELYRSIDYGAALHSREQLREMLGRVDVPFLLGALLTVLILALAIVLISGRYLTIILRRPGGALYPRFRYLRVVSRTLLLACILLVLFGWPVRLASLYMQDTDVKLPRPTMKPQETHLMLRAGVIDLPTTALRSRALHHMILTCHPRSREIIEDALRHERDPALRVPLLHLLGLHRSTDSLSLITRDFHHTDPSVRAAAMDAAGLVCAPAHSVDSEHAIQLPSANPAEPIACSLEPLLRVQTGQTAWSYPGPRLDLTPRPMPPELRERLSNLMLSAPTPQERQAAARALVPQRPADYQLRIAEWGVWVAAGDQKSLARAIDDIPPFVHRTGNPAVEFNQRIRPSMMVINKPVIHITASQPLVLDLEVLIRDGRPWFAYPRPDDFTIHVGERTVPLNDGVIPPPPNPLTVLDNPRITPLANLHEGYPFISPGHRFHISDGKFGLRSIEDLQKQDTIESLGLRWQSLIISPTRLPWMNPPPLPPDPRYQWWGDLRDVPCSHVSNRDEADRFLYYDGPSNLPPPVVVSRATPTSPLHFEISPPAKPLGGLLLDAIDSRALSSHPSDRPEHRLRHGLAVHVAPGGALTLHRHRVPTTSSTAPFATDKTFHNEHAISHFLDMLREAGLTEPEARGLLSCWRKEFFEKPGSRFLLLMSPHDYHHACPMRFSLPPTAIARVGLIVTELP